MEELDPAKWPDDAKRRLIEAVIERPLTESERRSLYPKNISWEDRDPDTGRHNRNGHLIQLGETDWRCQICGHTFDAASDAELFVCGEDCRGKHIL